MRNRVRGLLATAMLAALLTPLPGCESNEQLPAVVVVTPQPVRSIWAQTAFEGFYPDTWISIELLLADRGQLDITVDWTVTNTWMYVYFGDTQCDFARLSSQTCPFLIRSETKDPKPRILYTDILDTGTYYLYLFNVPWDRGSQSGSDNREAVSIQVGLTVGLPEADSGESEEPIRLGRPNVVAPPRF